MLKRFLVVIMNSYLLLLPTLAWSAAPGEKAPDMAVRQVKLEGLGFLNHFFAGWYNDNKMVFAIIVTVIMGVVGMLIALVTDVILKNIGMEVSKIEHHE
jgi:hypothetical protein